MKIKLSMPVHASAEFEAEIDIEGKTPKEIIKEFWIEMDRAGSSLCHQCSRSIETDFEIIEDSEDLDKYMEEELIEQYLK